MSTRDEGDSVTLRGAFLACPRCGKERWCKSDPDPELTEAMKRLYSMSLCRACEHVTSLMDDSCPEVMPMEGGRGVTACALRYSHMGRCIPAVTMAELRAARTSMPGHARCPVCGGIYSVRKDGRLRRHGLLGRFCKGSFASSSNGSTTASASPPKGER